ncbi:hypothetical protein CPT_Pipo_011 [Acinetobacter phage Pipo]|uniref:Uncharacterized protein n=1 Tax=Acinetobacter phage Pipo TaxID=2797425 RepID=A0A7T8ETK0_9CAUD|nr:hypothetical protein CPT_Pipo_011 [Acinetobacter phage Pipo]
MSQVNPLEALMDNVLTTGLFCLTYAVLSAYEWLANPSKEEHDHG